MSHRLQVLVPKELDTRIQMAARRLRISKGEWVRRAVQSALEQQPGAVRSPDPVGQLATLNAPTGDIDQILAEIEAGRS